MSDTPQPAREVSIRLFKERQAACSRGFEPPLHIDMGLISTVFLLAVAGTNRPVAVLDQARKDQLAGLRSGQSATLDCLGNGHVSGTPMLKNCTLVQQRP